jgi:hypothetical protein
MSPLGMHLSGKHAGTLDKTPFAQESQKTPFFGVGA